VISVGPLDHLDHAPTRQFVGGKIGIDATHKGPNEGTRLWPEEIRMSDEVKELVTQRWAEYGLRDLGADGGEIRHSPAALRQVLRR
jgi:4-hydroxy-3-polyprenylbenzoate decarboxylase